MRIAVIILKETKRPHEHCVSDKDLKTSLEWTLNKIGWWDLESVTVGEHQRIKLLKDDCHKMCTFMGTDGVEDLKEILKKRGYELVFLEMEDKPNVSNGN